jgi:hypothetical protein
LYPLNADRVGPQRRQADDFPPDVHQRPGGGQFGQVCRGEGCEAVRLGVGLCRAGGRDAGPGLAAATALRPTCMAGKGGVYPPFLCHPTCQAICHPTCHPICQATARTIRTTTWDGSAGRDRVPISSPGITASHPSNPATALPARRAPCGRGARQKTARHGPIWRSHPARALIRGSFRYLDGGNSECPLCSPVAPIPGIQARAKWVVRPIFPEVFGL